MTPDELAQAAAQAPTRNFMIHMLPAAAVTDALATFRLTRLAVTDRVSLDLRAKIIEAAYARHHVDRRKDITRLAEAIGHDLLTPDAWLDIVEQDPDPPKLAYLVTCPWCAGVYIAAGVVLLRRYLPRWWEPMAEALALSAASGLVSEWTN